MVTRQYLIVLSQACAQAAVWIWVERQCDERKHPVASEAVPVRVRELLLFGAGMIRLSGFSEESGSRSGKDWGGEQLGKSAQHCEKPKRHGFGGGTKEFCWEATDGDELTLCNWLGGGGRGAAEQNWFETRWNTIEGRRDEGMKPDEKNGQRSIWSDRIWSKTDKEKHLIWSNLIKEDEHPRNNNSWPRISHELQLPLQALKL